MNKLLRELGIRQRPVIAVLDRSNPINRFLGKFFRKTIPGLGKKIKT